MDSSVAARKTSRKRKKHPVGNPTNNTPKRQKFARNSDASNEMVKKRKSFTNKYKKSEAGAIDIQNPNKCSQSNVSINTNIAKKLKKNVLKTREIVYTKPQSLIQSKSTKNKKIKKVSGRSIQVSPVNKDSSMSPRSLIQLKSKKKKKVKIVSGRSIQVSLSVNKDASMSPIAKNVSKVKKGKKKLGKLVSNLEEKRDFESDDELSDICISDDDESDEEVLREEIQNFSVFKQIEKLMKKAPHLNPANAGLESPENLDDEDVDNSSDLNLSVESNDQNSVMETDNQDSSSSISEDKTTSKENISAKKQDQNLPLANKKNNFTEKVAESTGFTRTSKDIALRRNVSNKDKKGEMSSNLKNKVQEKLAGAKFRFLNEKLYTETGKEAFEYFQENTEEFEDYHSGYRLQVSKWPMNPVNEIISDIQKLKKGFVIADLGCGEAKIAQTFPDRTVHSFDLVPLNEFVKACDISKIPLQKESVDVVVFCLSLMGTNLKDYLCEAFRILKVGGILKIAEVESRIEDFGHFINYLKSVGFKLERKNTKHKMFVFLDLKKEKQKCKLGKVPSLSLRPCMYKKR